MNGKLIAGFLILCGIAAGAGVYYQQVYAYYRTLGPNEVSIRATLVEGPARVLDTSEVSAIDADSSPIRFRACFTADPIPDPATFAPVENAEPRNAPGWFDCFDAAGIAEDIGAGRAVAVLGERNVIYGIDRVLALYPDGRGVAWHQINECGEVVFDGKPAPEGCPPAPVRDAQ